MTAPDTSTPSPVAGSAPWSCQRPTAHRTVSTRSVAPCASIAPTNARTVSASRLREGIASGPG
ncbi:hypothetical protein DZF99_07175 [Clavibacter phaseoli]|nr:hypothetical protein DZF99_07175 [Clavibacter phaseoli]